MASTAFDTEAFDRATDGLLTLFSKEQARRIVEFRGDQRLRERIEELAHKSTEEQLTEAERSEYEAYVRANKFIATLQAKSRKLLADE